MLAYCNHRIAALAPQIESSLKTWVLDELNEPPPEPSCVGEWGRSAAENLSLTVISPEDAVEPSALLLKQRLEELFQMRLEKPLTLLPMFPAVTADRQPLRTFLRRAFNDTHYFSQELPQDDLEPLDLGVKIYSGPFFLLRVIQDSSRELTPELVEGLAERARQHPAFPVVVSIQGEIGEDVKARLESLGLLISVVNPGVGFPEPNLCTQLFKAEAAQFAACAESDLPVLPEDDILERRYGSRLSALSQPVSPWGIMKLQAEILAEAGLPADPLHWYLTWVLVHSVWQTWGGPQDYFNRSWLRVAPEWCQKHSPLVFRG